MQEQTALFLRFGVALFIGILVGLQREYAHDASGEPEQESFAGIRTFALMGLAGCTAAYAADVLDSPWVFVGLLLPIGAFIAIAYYVTARAGNVGLTTEVAAVVTMLAGAICFWDELALAVAIGVVTTVLLSLKIELHGFAARLTREDMLAALKFAIITAIILPILPNVNYGPPPLDVINPYKIWLMVVLISAISFLGYVLFKVLGSGRGTGLTGLLGGLVSSTATTLSFSQRSHKSGHFAKPFAMAIIIAWTVMFARVLIEVGAIHFPLLGKLWLPLVAAGAVGLLYGIYLYLAPRADDEEDVQISNPFELRPAITFGILYGVILIVARAAQVYLGDTGIYLSSVASGLADVDAITLSMTELTRSGDLAMPTAARAIILAVVANTVVKGGIVLASGSRPLRRAVLPGFILILGVALLGVFLL
jgi:uncharacterized membrane protein (DUF4010 family)